MKNEPTFENSKDRDPWPITFIENSSYWQTKVRKVAYIVKTVLYLKARTTLRKSKRPIDANNEIIDEPKHRYLLRFQTKKIENRKNRQIKEIPKNKKVPSFLKISEKTRAEPLLRKAIQAKHFHKELATLSKWSVFEPDSFAEFKAKNSKLTSLSQGILRERGRSGISITLSFGIKHLARGPSRIVLSAFLSPSSPFPRSHRSQFSLLPTCSPSTMNYVMSSRTLDLALPPRYCYC